MSGQYVQGTDGRVRNGDNVPIGGITKWDMGKKTTVMKIPHFEGPVETVTGKIYQNVLTGLSEAEGSLEGYFDTSSDAATDTVQQIDDGIELTLDLIMSKEFTFGFYNVPVVFSEVRIGVVVENQPTKFTANFTVNGVPGRTSATPS